MNSPNNPPDDRAVTTSSTTGTPGHGNQQAMQTQTAPQPAGTPKRGIPKLYFILGGIALAGALVLFLSQNSGDDGFKGFETPEELADAALTALSKGDADATVRLTGGVSLMRSILQCENPSLYDDYEDAIQFKRLAIKVKGAEYRILSVNEEGKRDKQSIGDDAGDGCTYKENTEIADFVIKLADENGQDMRRSPTMSALLFQERWYLYFFSGLQVDLSEEQETELEVAEEKWKAEREKRKEERAKRGELTDEEKLMMSAMKILNRCDDCSDETCGKELGEEFGVWAKANEDELKKPPREFREKVNTCMKIEGFSERMYEKLKSN